MSAKLERPSNDNLHRFLLGSRNANQATTVVF